MNRFRVFVQIIFLFSFSVGLSAISYSGWHEEQEKKLNSLRDCSSSCDQAASGIEFFYRTTLKKTAAPPVCRLLRPR